MKHAWLAFTVVFFSASITLICAEPPGPAANSADASPASVLVPPGVTPLGDIGRFEVSYQRHGKGVTAMPYAWQGGFTEDSGICFEPANLQGRPAMLLHCPWRGGSGSVMVDYKLTLPQDIKTRFEFGIAIRGDGVGKCPGIAFSVHLADGGQFKELFRENYALGDVKPISLDLSAWAGKTVTLRIQTEPVPGKGPSFGFSLFVEPRLIAGQNNSSDDAKTRLLAAMTSTKAYALLRDAGCVRANNRGGQGITPCSKLDGVVSVCPAGRRGVDFLYQGPDGRLTFGNLLDSGKLSALTAQFDAGLPFQPCAGGGITLANGKTIVEPNRVEVLSHKPADNACIQLACRYSNGEVSATIYYRLRMQGKAFVIQADSNDAVIATFSLGRPVADFRRSFTVPYLAFTTVYFLQPQNLFTMSYLDWTQSHGSSSHGATSTYTPRLDGKRNTLHEVGYVAVSPDLDETLPNIPHPPSPYLPLLGPKMMLDLWGGSFETNARLLEQYKSYGIDEAAIIMHNWQRYGYDVKLPDHLPANPNLGGDEKMKLLADTARKCGYVFSVHENYIDFYPDAPSWDPNDIVLNSQGQMAKAWFQPGTGVQSFAIKTNRMLKYAAMNSPEIHKRYGTTASYLDVHPCVPPWHHVDFDANQELAGQYAAKVKYQAALFQYERDTHKGPLFGEGNNHFFWAGLVDGVEAQVDGGEDRPLLASFDLLKLHPQMVNHGMGYYERWLHDRKLAKKAGDWRTPAMMDKYRAQELAYGHAAFIGSGMTEHLHAVVREYNLCQPVQALYGNAKAASIFYEINGQMVTAGVAAVTGVMDRIRVNYDSGLTLHVNLGEQDWTVGEYAIPQFGFLATGPNGSDGKPGVVAYTARRDGVIADFARTRDSLYVDARTDIRMPWSSDHLKNIEPRLKSFRDLGGGKIELTYEWLVNDTFAEDQGCFVHFISNKNLKADGEGIVFQNDHNLRIPPSKWTPGQTIVDGPYVVHVPAGDTATAYDITIGLHSKATGRTLLKGVNCGGNRILIGRLAVERKDGKVQKVELASMEDARAKLAATNQAFMERMNTEGRRVDFGPAATDGAFKALAVPGGLDILPFPRNKVFRIELNVSQLPGGQSVARHPFIKAVDVEGKELADVPCTFNDGRVIFQAGMKGAVKYQLRESK